MKKHIILSISLLGSSLPFILPTVYRYLRSLEIRSDLFGPLYEISFFFPVILLFSLLTYKLSDQVFNSWWAFARFAIPIIFILVTLISMGVHHDPYGTWQGILDAPMMIALYIIFAIGSLVQMARAFYGRKRVDN